MVGNRFCKSLFQGPNISQNMDLGVKIMCDRQEGIGSVKKCIISRLRTKYERLYLQKAIYYFVSSLNTLLFQCLYRHYHQAMRNHIASRMKC